MNTNWIKTQAKAKWDVNREIQYCLPDVKWQTLFLWCNILNNIDWLWRTFGKKQCTFKIVIYAFLHHLCVLQCISNKAVSKEAECEGMWVKVASTTSSMSTTNNKQFKTNHKKLQFPRIWLVHKSLYFGFAWLPIWLTGAGKPN